MVYDYDCIFNLHNYNQLYSSLHNYVYVHCISVILKWELEVIFFKPLRNQASDVEMKRHVLTVIDMWPTTWLCRSTDMYGFVGRISGVIMLKVFILDTNNKLLSSIAI